MLPGNILLSRLVLVGLLLSFPVTEAAAQEVAGKAPVAEPCPSATPNNSKASLRHQHTLEPFFLMVEKDCSCRVERILVKLEVPSPTPGIDFSDPHLRKILYDYLRSGTSENEMDRQILAALNQRLGQEAVTAVSMSRSILMVR